ncbi:ATP-binding protein, partial [Halorussus sp. GCM10023401]
MTEVLGRKRADDGDATAERDEATGHLGAYRARDGSPGATVRVDMNRPHAGLVVGKRGYGKSYTLGVLAEELARTGGVAPVVADPMGVFGSLADLGEGDVSIVTRPRVSADALAPRAWCDLLGLAPDSAAGTLVWRAAAERDSLAGMTEYVADAEAVRPARRAASNHLALAASWGVFDAGGLAAGDLLDSAATVLDLSALPSEAANAVVRAVASGLYDRCAGRGSRSEREDLDRLPWLLVDEAHAFFDGVAGPALRTLLTRGRQPGASFVAATQRPGALPPVAVSQADLLVAHRLTSRADLDALAAARPTYVSSPLAERLPERPGDAVVVDDATESVHAVRIRERETPHGGESPRASRVARDAGGAR